MAEQAQTADGAKAGAKKKIRKGVTRGVAHIKATFNNTMVTITDHQRRNDLLGVGRHRRLQGRPQEHALRRRPRRRKRRPAGPQAGMVEIEVKVKGPGAGREQAIFNLQNAGLKVTGIEDVTPLPHNGCRPPKKRRV